jgi:hypothetical protein
VSKRVAGSPSAGNYAIGDTVALAIRSGVTGSPARTQLGLSAMAGGDLDLQISANGGHSPTVALAFNRDPDSRSWQPALAAQGTLRLRSGGGLQLPDDPLDAPVAPAAASRSLWIQHPKFVDAVILDRIISARERGVKVRLLCGGKHGISDWDIYDTFASLRIMQRFGVKVRRQKHLKLHASEQAIIRCTAAGEQK